MSDHLSKNELEQIIQKTPQHLTTNRFLHYEKCIYCQNLYKEQVAIHGMLSRLSPVKAPKALVSDILGAVSQMSSKTAKIKTDWLFLFALMTLFSISIWFVFNSSFGEDLNPLITKIIPDSEVSVSMPSIIDNIKEELTGFGLSFELFKVNGHKLYLVFGFLSIVLYIFLDKKMGRLYKIK